MASKRLKVTLVGSPNRRTQKHKACVKGLGLKRMHHTVEVPADSCHLGMISAVSYLLRVEEVD